MFFIKHRGGGKKGWKYAYVINEWPLSSHIRKSPFLQTDMERVANDFLGFLSNNNIPASELKKTRMQKIKMGELPLSCR